MQAPCEERTVVVAAKQHATAWRECQRRHASVDAGRPHQRPVEREQVQPAARRAGKHNIARVGKDDLLDRGAQGCSLSDFGLQPLFSLYHLGLQARPTCSTEVPAGSLSTRTRRPSRSVYSAAVPGWGQGQGQGFGVGVRVGVKVRVGDSGQGQG